MVTLAALPMMIFAMTWAAQLRATADGHGPTATLPNGTLVMLPADVTSSEAILYAV